ncbi:uncharacterized protein N7469_002476 [Penicillium citrinum]|uniref:F-box domain-containing protein n=1 Tax=Penicillium citrinum TaxID=5077 RepID=A0A9W9PAQ5_PENCI|nr:uncharacterized protein N7469_002476 [Penicillium citrinum]KAJ5240885.1 hypothetical protein N7469_002476 [Penicillium citrinum]
MGYSEIYCHICGVSFNIARRRKPGEPDLASWDYTGKQDDYPGVDEVDIDTCAQNGCFAAIKYPKEDDDILKDPDYIPRDEGLYSEPDEYDSEYETVNAMSVSGEDEANSDSNDDDRDGDEDSEVDFYSDWLAKTLDPQGRFPGEPVGNFGYSNERCRDDRIFSIQPSILSDGHDPEELEHIPNRACTEANAYSGFAISLDEMRGCRTAQCLVHKGAVQDQSENIIPLDDWEISGNWFLSGLCDGMPSRDCSSPYVWPAQGGVNQPRAENVNFDPEWTTSEDLAMPFHPWCFDIFCRQSKTRFNCINIPGLIKWRNSELSYDDFHSFPRSADVFEGQDQFWHHAPGREYLAANPLYVPALPTILLNAAKEKEEWNQKIIENPKPPKYHRASSLAVQNDVFALMPPEICLLIISYLNAGDLTNLRIASKVFTKLPNGVWQRLIREEMPWLWESHYDDGVHHPSVWTAVTANDLMLLKEERKRYSKRLREDYTSTKEVVDYLLPIPKEMPNQLILPKESTNWHAIYTQIKKNWSNLKGLKNRKRIWEDVEEIMARIEKCEAES